jgi:hypothetical protein
MRRLLIGPLAALAASASILVGSATVASATHTVRLGGSATLVSKGAGVLVPVEVTCTGFGFPPPPFPPFPGGSNTVTVQVNQRSGNRIAQGFGSASVVCDGTQHTVDVLVTASQAPFKHGTALATASMFLCDFSGCHPATDSHDITITK